MTTLNSRLQLAMLNRKKGRNWIEKGFTLVELMVVIVIVGVLSSVALPNFLNQTAKAKSTECTTKMASLLKQVQTDYQIDSDIEEAIRSIVSTNTGGTVTPTTAATTVTSPDAISKNSDGGLFLYTVATPDAADTQLQIKCTAHTTASKGTSYPTAEVDSSLAGQGMYGCIDLESGKVETSRRLETSGTTFNLTCGGAQATDIPSI